MKSGWRVWDDKSDSVVEDSLDAPDFIFSFANWAPSVVSEEEEEEETVGECTDDDGTAVECEIDDGSSNVDETEKEETTPDNSFEDSDISFEAAADKP